MGIHRFFALAFFTLLLSVPILRAQEDCRVTEALFKPIIRRFNPYFNDHHWDKYGHIESARMDGCRFLVIGHRGCKRHHTLYTLYISPHCVNRGLGFWVEEWEKVTHCMFEQSTQPTPFDAEFFKTFGNHLAMYGVNKPFNFPIGSRNFFCEIEESVLEESKIKIEVLEHVFLESFQGAKPISPSPLDDGWQKQ